MASWKSASLLSLVMLAVAEASVLRHPQASADGATRRLRQQRDKLWEQGGLLWKRLEERRQPPNGALYAATVGMPVIGKQTFMLRVLSRPRGKITLRGRLDLDEPVTYQLERYDAKRRRSKIHLTFNKPTLLLLSRWRTRIRAVWYDADGDYALLVVAPPVIPAIRIKLNRVRQ